MFLGTNGQCSQQACQGKTRVQYLRRSRRAHGAGFKSPGVDWKHFREPRRQFRIIRATTESVVKVGRSLGIWRNICLIPDGDRGSLDFCCRYLVGSHIRGIHWGTRAKRCGGRKRIFNRDLYLLEIYGWGPCQCGIFGSGLTSFEDVDDLNRSPGEDMPCGYVGSRYMAYMTWL